MLKISQNNDNRGRHLEFYFHTGIGNWFQCFLVYPGLNLSSGSGSGFRIPDSSFSICPLKTDSCVQKLLRASKNELSFAQLLAAHFMFAKKGEKFHF